MGIVRDRELILCTDIYFNFGRGINKMDHSKKRKKTPLLRGFYKPLNQGLRVLNVGSLLAFRALRDFERYFLTFFQGLEAVHLDCGKVGEQILTTVIRSDKAETFGIIEPLDGTCCHNASF